CARFLYSESAPVQARQGCLAMVAVRSHPSAGALRLSDRTGSPDVNSWMVNPVKGGTQDGTNTGARRRTQPAFCDVGIARPHGTRGPVHGRSARGDRRL